MLDEDGGAPERNDPVGARRGVRPSPRRVGRRSDPPGAVEFGNFSSGAAPGEPDGVPGRATEVAGPEISARPSDESRAQETRDPAGTGPSGAAPGEEAGRTRKPQIQITILLQTGAPRGGLPGRYRFSPPPS